VQRMWVTLLEEQSRDRERELASLLEQQQTVAIDSHFSAIVHEIEVHRAVVEVWRNYLQKLTVNGDEIMATQAKHSDVDGATVLFDCHSSCISALHSVVSLCQLLMHLDASLLCVDGRTLYQSMEGGPISVL
jgi:hypothetical protein